jgi:hypothetical protein
MRIASSVLLALVLSFAVGTSASAQSVTTSLSGLVVDANGGVVPGATVVVKNNATGTVFDTVTNGAGVFSVPALDPSTYTVLVSLEGFKTATIAVRLVLGTPASIKAVLEVGSLSETVTISAATEIVNTQTATVSSTLNVEQVNQMPLPSRNALNAVTFLTGVNTTGINRDANVNGLPQSFLNLTLDGVSNNDNYNKSSDGFFAMITPRQDAVEAVTVTAAGGGADVGGSGAVSVNFVTRSGTNRFTGSAYGYFRDPRLNTNYWFNERDGLPKNDVKLYQYGARQGGPIVIPGLYDGRGKAFFFANYEEFRMPNNFSRTRTTLHPRAQEGWFRYTVTVGGAQVVREVNLLQVASAARQLASTDPVVMRTLGLINSATERTGVVKETTDPLLMDYVFLSTGNQTERQPVVRLDYNLTDHHRLSAIVHRLWVVRDPDHLNNLDARFPGAPNYRLYNSMRPSNSITLRSTLSSTLVSELRAGYTKGGYSNFGTTASNGPQTFADMGGYAIDFDQNIGLTNWFATNAPNWRSAYQYTVDETLNWQRGKHSLTFGASAYLGRAWEEAQQMVPGIQLGLDSTNDPAAGLFTGGTTGNFPGASSSQLTDARELYGLLTGRVTSVTGQASLDPATMRYSFLGARRRAGKMDVYSLFAQDSWRLAPTLTLNGGLRWDVQLPFTPTDDVMTTATLADVCGISGLGDGSPYGACRFRTPGANGGVVPQFEQFKVGSSGYHTDWNNIAPNVGIAWRPNVEKGWLRTLLGDPAQAVLRAGYSVAYDRQGMAVFTGVFGPNPGSTLSLTRDVGTGLVGPGESWPVLLRETNRLYPAPYDVAPTFPIPIRANRADSINAFHPNTNVASAHNWTIGFQRAVSKDMAIEIRYLGTRGIDQWSTINYNAIRGENLIANGFLDEFRLAMTNLQANNTAGGSRAGSFAYFGPGTGTSPLPIYLAYLNGRTDATNAAAYSGGSSTWSSSTIAGRLVAPYPRPVDAAADLDGNLTRRTNALAAGLPANFFVVNPHANQVNVTDSGAYSDYHALQLEVRRRLSKGLQFNASYQYAREGGSSFLGFQFGRAMNPAASVRHAFKTQWDWSIPVGRGQRFGSGMHPVLDALLGGWHISGVGRIQARMVDFSSSTTIGNVRLVGMTESDLQKMYKFDIRPDPATGLQTVFMLPDDVILNTRRAFNIDSTSFTGYSSLGVPEGRYIAPANSAACLQIKTGDCAPRSLMIRAPLFTRVDVSVTKTFPIRGRLNLELKADVMNLFDNINFTPVANPGPSATIFQVTTAYRDPSNTFDPGGRLGQISIRLNW